ncbi:MAG: NAD(P)H-dependent oxidoreductase subunit E [Candidatus Limnocylindrales bacterium]
MDLHVVAPLASPVERAAVDAVLVDRVGPPTSWHGGPRATSTEGHVARGGHDARAHRDLLLPTLLALQDHVGYISQPALGYVCRRLSIPPAEAYGVATFYSLLATTPRPPAVAHVCEDLACRLAGSEGLCASLERSLGPAGEPAIGGRATWLRSPCLGQCERAPAALFTIAGEAPNAFAAGRLDAPGITGRLEAAVSGRSVGRDAGDDPWGPVRQAAIRASVPQAAAGGLTLLARVGVVDPNSLGAYRTSGGYVALTRAIEMGPTWVIEEVTASRLVGRGGAAFPTGRKWAAVAAAPAMPHYLVCNADESEPGTFKDRLLMEEDPFAVVEAMTVAAFATGATRGYVYIRGEYPLAAARLQRAVDQARAAGLLGPSVMGSGFAFDVELRLGAGAYICGEETALFESIEGKRGEPRNKPPFPVEVGLFGQPTAINNVETLANVLPIVQDGAAAFAAIGTDGSSGTKLFCLSGQVGRPGLYEVPFGTTLRALLELADGPPADDIRAILLGGAAGVFVGPEALDVALTFEGTRAIGATLGSGVVMVFGRDADLVGAVRRVATFFRDESCGQCVPCRVGSVRQEELLARLDARHDGWAGEEAALLRELGQAMRDASICGLGQTASSAIESVLRQPGLLAS